MGQRANLVIVSGGQRTLYDDHWCANRLDVELFWGPRLALEFAARLAPVAEPDGWLDTRWCEGAAVLDFDRSILTWFGGEDVLFEPPLRRAHLALMAPQWPGWDIQWAHEGILSIADALALPREPFRAPRLDGAPPRDDTPEPLRFVQGAPVLGAVATSVRRDDGSVIAAGLYADEDVLCTGPDLVDAVLAHGSDHPLRWEEEGFPLGGIHVDRARRTLDMWWARETHDVVERTRAAWPGWIVRWHRDQYEHQLELADGRLILSVERNLPIRVVRSLEAHIHREARNPARESLPALAASGLQVDHLNPATDIARGSVGSAEQKRALLALLARSLASTT